MEEFIAELLLSCEIVPERLTYVIRDLSIALSNVNYDREDAFRSFN